MVDVTAGMVKQLREKTDAPMLECKKALVEANGDFDAAEELLRVRLGNKALRASGRSATEGTLALFVAEDGKSFSLVEVNCETDFVVKNEFFQEFAMKVAQCILDKAPASVEELLTMPLSSAGTVEEERIVLVGKVGENVAVRRFVKKTTAHSFAAYVHNGRAAACVEFSGDFDVARDVAMHIVACRPACLNRDGIEPELLAREQQTFARQAIESGKAPEIAQKMAEGRLNKFLAEVSLVEQPFVKDTNISVAEYLKSKSSAIYSFDYLVVGEGLEKAKNSFVEDVAAVAARSS